MLSKVIRTFIWMLVHILYTIIENILLLWMYISLKIAEFKRLKRTEDSIQYVNNSMKCVIKIPKHVVLILDEHEHSHDDLAKLVIWSLTAGISYFSFYDKTGQLNKNEEKLFASVEKLKAKVPGHIKWTNQPDLNGYTNGKKYQLTVNLLTIDDGRKKIVSAVQNLCDNARRGSLDPSVIDVEYIDQHLARIYPSIPEPNLAIYCGNNCRTNGLLPWHIRLTEFFSLGSHRIVKVESFVRLLHSYGKCEQRFGK